LSEIVSALLVNPNSGGGSDPILLEALEQALSPSGGRLIVTNSARQACDFVARAQQEGFTRLIVSGGDDSVRDMLPALLRTRCELGIVPCGTFNNLARALGLPSDPMEALELALTGTARPTDLGRVAGHLFTESAGVGFLAEAWSRAPQPEPTGFRRWATGFLAASAALMDYQPVPLTIRLDGVESREAVWDLTVANAPMFANNIAIAPHASLQDGLLDVCLWPAVGRLEFLAALPTVLKESAERIPDVRIVQARVVEVVAPREIPVRADNAVDVGKKFTFEVLGGALKIVRP
jgi:YegS/Rv2252/BmrU family lipid kinase